MIRNLFEQMSSRREWLRSAGLGASIAVLPAAVTSGAVFGKDDAMQDIMHLIKIHAPSERVYEAITTADGIRQWWTRDVAIELKVGAAGEFGFNGKRFVATRRLSLPRARRDRRRMTFLASPKSVAINGDAIAAGESTARTIHY
jgi:hypothetical protein